MNDTERLDYLDSLTGSYSEFVVMRWSTMGRGWRLHESTMEGGSKSVREAIDKFAKYEQEEVE